MPGLQITSGTQPNKEINDVLSAGTRLYDYEIISVLRLDDFGVTYLARDTNLECRVAIREYLPASLALREGSTGVVPRSTDLSEQFVLERRHFVSEASALAKLGETPAVVRIDDLFEANGTAYLVMELADGETLRWRLWREQRLPSRVIERMLSSLLTGLEKVHSAGLLHRDIQPANIILDRRGNPTLIDFGGLRTTMAGRTGVMTAAFAPDYAAPEQFTAGKQGPWTDIYDLSATLYHAITGAPPPNASDRLFDDAYRPLAALKPSGFSADLLHGIDVGLKVRSSDRPQSIAAWRATLPVPKVPDDLADFVMLGPTAATLAAAARPRLWIWTATAFVATLAVSTGALKLMGPSTKSADVARGSATAELQRQAPPDDVQSQVTVARNTTAEAIAPADKRELVQESGQKVADDMLVAAARGGEEEASQVRRAQESPATEAAREMAAVQGRAAPETIQREEAEGDHREVESLAAEASATGPDVEAALNLTEQDRKHVQAILTSLGHEIPTTGYFGPITRAMIAAWQKTQGLPETGFLSASQLAALYAMERTKLEAPRAEAALSLSDDDRKQVQMALTALGHDVPPTGYFGPITRSMIIAWQRTQGVPATGYLTAAQLATLQRQAAAGPSKYDRAGLKLNR